MPPPIRGLPWLALREGVYNICWYEQATPDERLRNPKVAGRTKRRGLNTRDAATAERRLREFIANEFVPKAFIATGRHEVGVRGPTVTEALDHYWDEHIERNVRAKERAGFAVRHLKEFFGDTLLSTIDKKACREFVEARRRGAVNGTRVGFATARRELIVLRAAANHALGEKRITANIMPTFELPAEERRTGLAPWFTKDELAKLFTQLRSGIELATMLGQLDKVQRRQRLLDFMTLAYWWGARKDSVAKLEASQVYFSEGLVNLNKDSDQITVKRRGIVPIFPEQRETLERLVRDATDGWLFGRDWGPRGYDPRNRFRDLCLACGISADKAKPHALRHSRATHMLMDGEPIYKVAKLLCDTTDTIEKHYGHFSHDWQLRST